MNLLEMSFAGSVMVLAILIIRALAINRLPKRTFLILWGIAAARLLLPLSIPSPFSVYSVLDGQPLGTAATDVPQAAGTLPAEVVTDIGARMQTIKAEIAQLQETTPPTDFTVDQIKAWLEVLKASADEKAVHLLIERIEVTQNDTKTDFNIQSTLKSVLGDTGCGDRT